MCAALAIGCSQPSLPACPPACLPARLLAHPLARPHPCLHQQHPCIFSPLTRFFCSLEEDALLSLISTRLATRQDRRAAAPSNPAALPTSAPGDATAPGTWRLQLPAAVQQWEVRWEDLCVVRPVGRGSFGRVYLATWRETPVAVKVGCCHGRGLRGAGWVLQAPASTLFPRHAHAAWVGTDLQACMEPFC